MDDKQLYLNQLVDVLSSRFSSDELNSLSFRVGINELGGQTSEEKSTELIKFIARHQHVPELLAVGKKTRPDVDWPMPFYIKTEWVDSARRMERNQAYVDAIKQWEKIQALDPQDVQVSSEIERLNDKGGQTRLVTDLKKRLSKRKLDIKSIYIPVASRLKRMEKEGVDDEAEILLETIEEFLGDEISAQDFMEFWAGMSEVQAPKNVVDAPNYKALAGRLQRGEIVMFLGLDTPAQMDQSLPCSDNIVPQLASYIEYRDFTGSFPEICEYMHLNHQFGRSSLRVKLQELVESSGSVSIALYQLLATIETPMLLISAAYESLLENAFKQANKKFVVLGYSTENLGRLLLAYSDSKEIQQCSTEELSGLQLLENGYSVIYKILGCFSLNNAFLTSQQDSLILSERDYLNFIQHKDQLIPNYVVTQLRGRGFWLLGHYPKSWENRLVIQEMLSKRSHEEQALTIHQDADDFARMYWENRRVKNYAIDLPTFVENLQKYL